MSSDRYSFSLERTVYILLAGMLAGLIFSANQSSRLALIDAHAEKPKADGRARRAVLADVLRALRSEDFLVLDVRVPAAFFAGSLPRAVNVSAGPALNDSTRELLKSRHWSGILIYGRSNSAEPYVMARSLAKAFSGQLLVYQEGWDEWNRAGVPGFASGGP